MYRRQINLIKYLEKRNFYGLIFGLFFCNILQAQELSKKEQKSMKRIEGHAAYLASDRLEGRATGSPGEKLSSEYIANQFSKNKVKPKGENESYFQNFDIVSLRIARDSTALTFNGIPYFLFKDFYPLSYSTNKKVVDGMMMSVDFGITAPELNYDDYKGKSVKGKVVLINILTPDSQQAHSKYLNYLSLETRVKRAESEGAVGVVFYNPGDVKENPVGELSKNIKPSKIPVFFFTIPQVICVPGIELPIMMKADILSISETGHNVIAYKDNKAKFTVVIGAHHDHLGRGEIKGSLEPNSNEVHNGADDNASGTSALIELSKQLKKRKFKKFNYLFIAFSGEEMGLLGSKYFVENPTINLKSVSFMLNMDMVGRLKETLIINGVGTSPYWNRAIDILKSDSSAIYKIKTTESGIGSSDHTSFYLANIPALHFFTGQHDDYHKPSDDIANLNLKGEVKVMGKIVELIHIAPSDSLLIFTKTKDENMRAGFKVTLGIMPDYAFDGEGVRIDGVKEGKPGDLAGLKKGDILTFLGGQKIPNMETYMKILTTLDKGQNLEITYIRSGVTFTSKVQF